jgi:hypothetical protein
MMITNLQAVREVRSVNGNEGNPEDILIGG